MLHDSHYFICESSAPVTEHGCGSSTSTLKNRKEDLFCSVTGTNSASNVAAPFTTARPPSILEPARQIERLKGVAVPERGTGDSDHVRAEPHRTQCRTAHEVEHPFINGRHSVADHDGFNGRKILEYIVFQRPAYTSADHETAQRQGSAEAVDPYARYGVRD